MADPFSKSANHVRVGVSVFVRNANGLLLMGKRKNSHGDGHWANPGGHLEFGETIEECAKREVLEETGLLIKDIRFLAITNDIFTVENKHYVTIHVIGNVDAGTLETREPHKVAEWDWFTSPNLPKPLFLSIENLLSQNPGLALS